MAPLSAKTRGPQSSTRLPKWWPHWVYPPIYALFAKESRSAIGSFFFWDGGLGLVGHGMGRPLGTRRSLRTIPLVFTASTKVLNNWRGIMEYATLGNTGLLVSKLCFGTMTFGDGRGIFKAISSVGQARADELVKTSIDGGVNFFDTADNYTEGESEKLLGQSLKSLGIARADVVIATKVYSRVSPGWNDIGASRGHIMSKRRFALPTPWCGRERSATSAAPTGRHGRSPKPSASPRSGTWPGSTRFRLITRSRAALSNGKSLPAGIRKGRSAGVESACRRPAFRQIQPDSPEAHGFAPH